MKKVFELMKSCCAAFLFDIKAALSQLKCFVYCSMTFKNLQSCELASRHLSNLSIKQSNFYTLTPITTLLYIYKMIPTTTTAVNPVFSLTKFCLKYFTGPSPREPRLGGKAAPNQFNLYCLQYLK